MLQVYSGRPTQEMVDSPGPAAYAQKTNVGTAYVGVYNLCYGGECGKSEGQHIEVVRAIPHPAYNDGTMVNKRA